MFDSKNVLYILTMLEAIEKILLIEMLQKIENSKVYINEEFYYLK